VGREQLLIEGYSPSELPEALGPDLEAEVVNGRPLVARVGTAEVLISLALDGRLLRAELAHVDGGGEGVLPTLISVILRLARRRAATEIEWLVFATNCAQPNPRLRPVLVARGFVVREVPDRGFCYYRRDQVASTGDSKPGPPLNSQTDLCGETHMYPKIGRLPSESPGETSRPWREIEATFAKLAQNNPAFVPLADLARHLANSRFAKAGLCGATSMHDLVIGPSANVFQNPHLRIEYDFDARTFQMIFVDGSPKPWETTVPADKVIDAVDRFLTKHASWYHLT